MSHPRAPLQLPRGSASAELASCAISQAQADAERAILVELYNATNGIFDADWANLTVPTCSLRQISCDACGAVAQLLAGGAVTLIGSLPASIVGLTRLTYLDVSQSPQLSGELTPAFAALNLTGLRLEHTAFSGQLHPAFSAWESLVFLDVGNTFLSGTIHPSLSRLTSLALVSLGGTLISGTLDPALSAWTRIERLRGPASLSGTLPPSLATWSNLIELDLSQSFAVSGTLSPTFAAWTSLAIMVGARRLCARAQ